MTARHPPAWQDDPELEAEAARLRAGRRPNGHDRGAGRVIELVPFRAMRPNLTEADLVAGLLGAAQLSTIYGPPGLGELMRAMQVVYGSLRYELAVIELQPAQTVERDGYLIAAIPVRHRAASSFAYAVVEMRVA